MIRKLHTKLVQQKLLLNKHYRRTVLGLSHTIFHLDLVEMQNYLEESTEVEAVIFP